VAATLHTVGHEVTVLDLCATGFTAAMSAEEKNAYDTPQPVVDPVVAAHVEAVRRADALVVVFPAVAGAPPAVLKGWFERVLVPGVAFVFDRRHKVRPGMRHVHRLVGICTYDERRGRVWRRGDAGRRLVTRTLRTSTGFRARTRWLAHYRGADPDLFRAHVTAVLGAL
jgi:putative NADPH-quinone reductase